MKKETFKKKLTQHYVKVIEVQSFVSHDPLIGVFYKVITDKFSIMLYGDRGRAYARILSEQFLGNSKLAILRGYVYIRKGESQKTIMFHPYLPFIINAYDFRDEY